MVAKSYTFQESVEYLLSLGNEVSAMKLGLENIRRLLAALGDPQKEYLKVQVAGTNGKGSVCAFLDSICREAGIVTGLFTSPHLISITERIKINGLEISEPDFARVASTVRNTADALVAQAGLDRTPTYFEQVTATALTAFAERKVQLAILETGLGGRLDATTAALSEIAAISRVDYDHQQYLGETIEEIAAEKAAILHSGSAAAIGEQGDAAMAVISKAASSAGVSPRFARDVCVRNDGGAVSFTTSKAEYNNVRLGLRGKHQIENAKLAVLTAEIVQDDLPISDEDIRRGLETARHPGRLEQIGNVLLDGAHNPGGAKALREFLDESVDQPVVLVFGAMTDKNIAEVAGILFPVADSIVLTRAANARSAEPESLRAFVPSSFETEHVYQSENSAAALAQARRLAGAGSLIVVSGSLYLVGEIKSLLQS